MGEDHQHQKALTSSRGGLNNLSSRFQGTAVCESTAIIDLLFPKNISGSEQFLSYKFEARCTRSTSQILNFPLTLINSIPSVKATGYLADNECGLPWDFTELLSHLSSGFEGHCQQELSFLLFVTHQQNKNLPSMPY